MKNIKVLSVLLAVLMSTSAHAATQAKPAVEMSCEVIDIIALNVELFRNQDCVDPLNCPGPDFAAGPVAAMDFNALEEVTFTETDPVSGKEMTFKELRPTRAYVAMISVNTHRKPYSLYASGSTLSNGTSEVPSGACVITTVYAPEDNAGASLPAGATLHQGDPWHNRTEPIYESGPTGLGRAIQAIVAITGDPDVGAEAAVPIDQPPGNYSGNIVFTLVTA